MSTERKVKKSEQQAVMSAFPHTRSLESIRLSHDTVSAYPSTKPNAKIPWVLSEIVAEYSSSYEMLPWVKHLVRDMPIKKLVKLLSRNKRRKM